MAIPRSSSSPPPHQAPLMTTPAAVHGAKKSATGGGKDVKQRAGFYMNKLSDRDTEALAVSELEAMARALPADSLPPFLSAISDTRPSDKTPLRRHCLRLLSFLSRTQPPQSLSPFYPRMVSSVLRRLRDPDSSVRSACVDAVRDMAISSFAAPPTPSSSPFCSVFLKPLSESLLLEQDQYAQMGSALCLAAAVEEASAAALGRDLAQHLHRLVPRLVKLARSEGFKAKPALLSLLGSVVAAGGASTPSLLEILVPCLADALSSDDWAARKAASEALSRVATIPDRHLLSGFRSSYFSSFQARRFDKVKIVRDSMNQMLEAWKDIPGALQDEDYPGGNTSPPPQTQSRSRSARQENESDGRLLVGSRISSSAPSSLSHALRKDRSPVGGSPSNVASYTPAASRTPPRNEKRTSPPLFRNLDRRKPRDWRIEIAMPDGPPFTVICKDELQNGQAGDEEVWEQGKNEDNPTSKLEVKRILFEKNSEQKINKSGGLRSGSRVVPFQEKGNLAPTVEIDELFEDNKDNDLTLIRKQLVQIENRQSSLLDLVQRFIGNSQNGIRSLETRVHGLEMALDEISHDLAMSSRRMPNTDPTVHCCKIPGAEFLSSKFWRRNEGRYSSRFSISGISSLGGVRNSSDKESVNSLKWEKRGFGLQSGFVMNPLAEVNSQSRGSSYLSSERMPKKTMHQTESQQTEDSNTVDEASTIASTA
uniref:Microtubule-associated protein TORTIFOLIA1 n=1 Tax=Anthurium amnicola TaxID=1678845 RepID=A0A1D1XIG6_9ARAE